MLMGVILAAAFCFSAYKVISWFLTARQEQSTFDTLTAIKTQGEMSGQRIEPIPAPANAPTTTQKPEVTEMSESRDEPKKETTPIPTEPPEPTPLPQYSQLYEMNPEFFGWLTIEAVEIDYPVMYSPTRPEYYLNRDYYGAYSGSGIPFVDGHCPAEGNYYLIYGHRMQNKTMFGQLAKYADESFCAEHSLIRFDTVYEQREYVVMAAFFSRIYDQSERGVFRYYEYFDLSDEAVFDEYVRLVKAAALYDTGIDAAYGDELLVLSTCNYYTAEGRFVVVSKRIT